ncbi:MAG: response regulator [Nitrospirae bacterium]|nr:MAG: response regulator [Nitrospirota bacterium]
MGKILVVDDEQMICDLLRAVLSSHGHEVLTATDGHEALTLFQQHQPSITLLDLRMPGMDGIDVLKQIRAMSPMAAVMVLTAGGNVKMENQARELGVSDFLKKGLSFDVVLGAMERSLQRSSPAAMALPAGIPNRVASVESREGATILVVDDEAMIRNLLMKFLTLRGYRVRVAQNGAEALAMVAQQQPDLVILDMYMPGMNGLDVLRELRARHYVGGAVALTASQDEKLLQQTLDLGSVDVIGKPVNLDRLELVVQVGLLVANSEPQVSGANPQRA